MNAELRKKYESNIWKIFLLYGLAGLGFFFMAITVLYYQSFNLSFTQIGLLLSSGMITTLLLEVPTGAFADLYGRKKSIIVGLFCLFIGISVITFSSYFHWFIIASVIMGLGTAFLSGAWEALLFDSIKIINREKDYLKITSKQQATFLIMSLFSSYFGPYLFSINIRYPYYVSVVATFLLFVFSFMLFEPEIKKKMYSVKKHYIQMKDGFHYIKKHNKLIWLISFSIFGTVTWSLFGELMNAPYILEKGFTLKQYALISLILTIVQSASALLSQGLEKKLKERNSFILAGLGLMSMLFLIHFANNYLIVIPLALFWSFVTFKMLIVNSYINHHLRKKIRATVISIHSMFVSLVAVIFLSVFGFIIDLISLSTAVFILAITSVVVGIPLLFVRYNKKIWKKLN